MSALLQISPKVFISYAWESEETKFWVKKLATDLRDSGVDATLDLWELVPGDKLPLFMERSIRENNYVLIVCTEAYKRKSENREGGVGYEGDLMTAEVARDKNDRKFVPILYSGSRATSIPSWLNGKVDIDFLEVVNYDNKFKDLLRLLMNINETAPPLGAIPDWVASELAAKEKKEEQNIKIEGVRLEDLPLQSEVQHRILTPFLEADLVWHGSSRAPRGYSDKNPTEIDENGTLITVIGAGVKPIILWELGWRFSLVVYNNSTVPAYNLAIESIGRSHFAKLENLRPTNNLPPHKNIELEASYAQFVEGTHVVADEIVKHKIPANLEGMELKLAYKDEGRSEHITIVKILDGKVVNSK